MATRDETHSTRGRANVLRLAMSGHLGQAGLDDDGVREVLDLCLECRSCKAECPVGVDVGRFKSEFLAQYWQRHGTPLRVRLLAHIHGIARWGSRLAPVSNAIAGSLPARWIGERVLGIDRRRRLPPWTRTTFVHLARARAAGAAPFEPSVALFNDTFTNFHDPAPGLAALDVMDRLNVAAALAPNVCCGRPLISQGLLEAARRQASVNTDRLHPLIARGQTIVFLEPSCLSAVCEDAPALLRGDAQRRARQVAARAMLFEEWLEGECQAGRAQPAFGRGPDRILVHGHCHQRAMGRLQPTLALLKRIPRAAIVDLDAGCCGMAGAFGYSREHFDVSRAIGERRLLPAARSLGPGTVLVASGTSCRHQVADFTDTRAVHVAELVRDALMGHR
jgi:Fe-S oxidoreductase